MLDEDLARIRAHRNNIHRYRRLIATKMSDVERQLIEKRLVEEQAALSSLSAETFPLTFSLPKDPADFQKVQGDQTFDRARKC
ncbi:hypothetical protein [Bradyrhizobium sp. BR 1432]|uniref:hypothetical protein n=1 Tax=Bradyrhizobium sp. BR 1432 TaxID=3447966 RepID=UPI003EE52BD0